ncbi:hypothetical protein Mapa_006204 [Marchantia paleacea]|nr:hypothetical protein Mapa_006204 [Marchantia paleacea]
MFVDVILQKSSNKAILLEKPYLQWENFIELMKSSDTVSFPDLTGNLELLPFLFYACWT